MHKTKLINIILECNFVELVQKMWRQELCPDLLETKGTLPAHLEESLNVKHTILVFCKQVSKNDYSVQSN